jgi:putative FmdB family regulatory protein
MPTYEYRCQDCGNRVEAVQSFTDEPLTVCDVCGGRLRRVFHPVGIVLKGSGFYSTDNRSGKRGSPATPKEDKTESAPAKPDSGATGGKTESGKTGGSSEQAS